MDGHDSYASLSGVDSEKEVAKPVLVQIGADKEWRQIKHNMNMNREHLSH